MAPKNKTQQKTQARRSAGGVPAIVDETGETTLVGNSSRDPQTQKRANGVAHNEPEVVDLEEDGDEDSRAVAITQGPAKKAKTSAAASEKEGKSKTADSGQEKSGQNVDQAGQPAAPAPNKAPAPQAKPRATKAKPKDAAESVKGPYQSNLAKAAEAMYESRSMEAKAAYQIRLLEVELGKEILALHRHMYDTRSDKYLETGTAEHMNEALKAIGSSATNFGVDLSADDVSILNAGGDGTTGWRLQAGEMPGGEDGAGGATGAGEEDDEAGAGGAGLEHDGAGEDGGENQDGEDA